MTTYNSNYGYGWNTNSRRRSTTSTTNRRGTTSSGGTTRSGFGSTFSGTKFNTYRNEIQARIGSYRNLNSQFSGSTVTGFSPTTANKWLRFVNTGTRVYSFNSASFTRTFGPQFNNTTPTTALKLLRKRFGTGVKAVTRGRNGTWLIAATPNVTGRPFNNYSWK